MQFIAQEIKKDGKIPPFDDSAIEEIMERQGEGQAGRRG